MTSITIDRRDGLSSATAYKGPCRVATTANITLAGEQTIDGIACVTGDRVLVKDQTDTRFNGVYVVDTGDWSRAKDFSRNDDVVKGTRVAVTDGATNAGGTYEVSASSVNLDTSAMTFIFVERLSVADITNLTAASAFTGPEIFPLVQLSGNRKGTISQVWTYVKGLITGSSLATSGVSTLVGVDGSGGLVQTQTPSLSPEMYRATPSTSDSDAFIAAGAAKRNIEGDPGESYTLTGIELSNSDSIDFRHTLVTAATGSHIATLNDFNATVERAYISNNAASTAAAFRVSTSRFATISDITGQGNVGVVIFRDDDGTGAAKARLQDIRAESITGNGVDVGSSVSEIQATNLHINGKVNYTLGLGKPQAGTVGWRQNTPLVGGLARGGHQIVNANMIALETGWYFTDSELTMLQNCIADSCSEYGIKVDGASTDMIFSDTFVGTTKGVYVGGTSQKIVFNGLYTVFNGNIPSWGAADFYNGAVTFYDVTVADTASVVIDGNQWRGNKRVSVASGATLVVTGGQWFYGRNTANVAAGSTVYLCEAGAFASASDALWRAPFTGQLFLLEPVVGTAPGAGETFTYTVQLNGVDTALTAQIAGAGVFTAKSYGPVSVTKGQSIGIKLVCSAATPAGTRHQVNVQMLGN